MSKNDSYKRQTSQAWFVVTEPGDDEQFSPGAEVELPEPIVRPAVLPTEILSAADLDGETPGSEVLANLPLPSRPEESINQAVDPPQSLDPPDAFVPNHVEAKPPEQAPDRSRADEVVEQAAVPDGGTQPQPAGLLPVQSDSGLILAREQSPLPARQISDFGFRQSDVIRVGGNYVEAPYAKVGLVVTTRTPQPVRLGQVVVLKEARTVVGRGRVGCFVDDAEVSHSHAVITYQRQDDLSGFFLHTCESAPTTLNGDQPAVMTRLQSGDRVSLGETELVFLEVPLDRGGDV